MRVEYVNPFVDAAVQDLRLTCHAVIKGNVEVFGELLREH